MDSFGGMLPSLHVHGVGTGLKVAIYARLEPIGRYRDQRADKCGNIDSIYDKELRQQD